MRTQTFTHVDRTLTGPNVILMTCRKSQWAWQGPQWGMSITGANVNLIDMLATHGSNMKLFVTI